MTQGPIPNLFIVGAPKCGTTFLYHVLGNHPQCFMSPVKEPRYFSDDLRDSGKSFHASHFFRHIFHDSSPLKAISCFFNRRTLKPERNLGITSEQKYLRLFRGADPWRHTVIGEASPESMWSETAASKIAALNPEARIIIMLREPLSYIKSMYLESLSGSLGEDVVPIEKALRLETARLRDRSVPCKVRFPFSVCYLAQAQFDTQIERFTQRFAGNRIHFVVLEHLAVSPLSVVNEVFEFLDISPIAATMDLSPVNVRDKSSCGHLPEDLRIKLRQEFMPMISRLEAITGFELRNQWGYR